MNIVVGTGYIGKRVLDRLEPGTATGLNRSPLAAVNGQTVITLDLDRADCLSPMLPPASALLYTVAPPENVGTDERLARLLPMLDPLPERFVYISTSGVYGDRHGDFVDESATPAPATVRAKKRLAAEKMLQSWCNDNLVEIVILRVPGIYGPQRLGLERIRRGEPIIRESEARPGNRIHADDLADCCIAAMSRCNAAAIYNIVDGDYRSSSWFSKTVARLASLPLPPEISLAEAQQEFSETRLSFLRESRKLDGSKMRKVLQFEPRFADAQDGIRDALRDSPRMGTVP